mgnify:CR=1 FL=1
MRSAIRQAVASPLQLLASLAPDNVPLRPCCCSTQAKTHEKVDSIGEERSIGCHAVIMLIRKDLC